MKKKLLLAATLAALGLASAVAYAGVNVVQQDDGDMCFSFDSSSVSPLIWCWDGDGDLTVTSDGTLNLAGTVTLTGALVDTNQLSVPIVGQCKVGATAGWVITAGTNISHATLPASQTNSTLVCPLPAMPVGSTVTAVALAGQVESAGGTVTATLSVRKLTNAAADNTDAEIANDTLGAGVTADTILSASNLGVSAQTEVIAADESLYVLVTATTAAATDIDATHLLVTYTSG